MESKQITQHPLLPTLGVICTALSFFLYLYALARLGPVRVTSFINLLPVVSVAGGMVLPGQRLL